MSSKFATVRAVFDKGSVLAAFDYLIAHARAAAFDAVAAPHGYMQSVAIRDQPGAVLFAAAANRGHVNFYLRAPLLSRYPGLFKKAERRFGAVKPNSRGEYRLRLCTPTDVDAVLEFLRAHGAWSNRRHDRRFVTETFDPITGEHLLRAAQKVAAGAEPDGFGPSTSYDLLFQGHRLPPKAVFGLAATEALGFPVRPENFTAGDGAVCFRILRDHGYPIVLKGQDGEEEPVLSDDEERAWSEGSPRILVHLRRERATGLATAKRDNFRARHGRLFCERCNIDPVQSYGTFGEACIEVHHHDTHVAEMGEGHQTRLDDLLCLCANCHRIAHRELRQT